MNSLKPLTADETLFMKEKKLKLDSSHDFQKDEEFQKWLMKLTNNILDGIFPRDVDDDNKEALMYLFKHPTKKLECGKDCLLLFKPENQDKFNECRRQITYKPNQEVIKDNKIYCNYYLNNITYLEGIFKYIDNIFKNEKVPYKISFDCGFIIEDRKEHTYSFSSPSWQNQGYTVPMCIKRPEDVQLYKHLVFSTLGDYTSEVHLCEGSRYHYVAMHSILFQVTRLGPAGARFMIPGYDFLIKNKYIRDYGNENNLCMFYVVANSDKNINTKV